MHLEYVCGRFSMLELHLGQICVSGYFMWHWLSVNTIFVADFKFIYNLCGIFYSFRFCLRQIFRSSIACVADFVCQDFTCGTLNGRFFHKI